MHRGVQGLTHSGLLTLPPDITQLSKGWAALSGSGAICHTWLPGGTAAAVTLQAKEHGSSPSGSLYSLALPFTEGSGAET